MSRKAALRLAAVTGGLLALLVIYLLFLFPLLDKDHRQEPVVVNTGLWQTGRADSLGYYYLERPRTFPVEKLQKLMSDSIFVVDFSKRNQTSITLREEDQPVLPFTNNYTSRTLYCYSYYLRSGDERYLDLFLKNARWMHDHATIIADTIALWTNDNMIYEKYDLSFGWPSSYGQGFGLSVMARAAQVTGDTAFLELGGKVVNSFLLSYRKGGITDIDTAGRFWYLEYPADPPGYVLNGMIFGLFGLYDFYRLTGSARAKHLFDEGVQTLAVNLHRYDMGYWSAYDLLYDGYCAGYNYHKNIHIPQLDALYRITGREVFRKYRERFESYLHEPYYSIFKIQFTLDAVHRRFTYKKPF